MMASDVVSAMASDLSVFSFVTVRKDRMLHCVGGFVRVSVCYGKKRQDVTANS